VAEKHGSFGFPVMVKPRRRGMGLASRANNLAELTRAMERAFCHDDSALVERYIGAQPIAVAILEGKVLGAVPKNPAPAAPALSPTRYRGVLNLAEQAARALETSGPVLVDVLVTEGQNEYVLEVDAAPNLTQNSVFSRIARADGLSFGELCEAVLSLARLHTRILASANPSSESPVVRTVHAEVPARRLAKGSDLSWRRSRTA
jgi:D-alanine-D-alanine ligase